MFYSDLIRVMSYTYDNMFSVGKVKFSNLFCERKGIEIEKLLGIAFYIQTG